jgi:uncharacterized membrane protein
MDEQNQNANNVTENSKKSPEKNIGMAVIAYIFFLIPLLTDAKDDKFVKFHIKQSLLLVCIYALTKILMFFPLVGLIFFFINPFILVVLAAFLIIGIINALNGEEKNLPLIGIYAEKIFKF